MITRTLFRPRALTLVPAVVALLLGPRETAAAGVGARTYVIAVGYNGVPAATADRTGEVLRALRFSDDDPGTVSALFRAAGDRGALLATFDGDPTRRHPELVNVTRPPTLAELRGAVAAIRARVAADLR